MNDGSNTLTHTIQLLKLYQIKMLQWILRLFQSPGGATVALSLEHVFIMNVQKVSCELQFGYYLCVFQISNTFGCKSRAILGKPKLLLGPVTFPKFWS